MRDKREDLTPRIIAIGNPKGGVGKTATTVSIARIIKDNPALRGKRVLIIDTDPLGILTKMIVGRKTKVSIDQTLIPVLQKNQPISSVIQSNAWHQVELGAAIDYICANRQVSKLESTDHFDFYRLKSALDEIKNDYFKILIDCPANSNNLYFAACIASDLIIFPFGSIESLSGIELTALELCQHDEQLIDNIKILFTMQDIQSELTASLVNTAHQYLDFRQFETIIRRSDKFSLEIADSQTTGTYHIPDSIAVNDYLFFFEELFAADFGKLFTNKQRFNFGHSKIDERLWAAFYETSFLITNEREKARARQPSGGLQAVHALERQIRSGQKVTSSSAVEEKVKPASRTLLVETCLKTCSRKERILGNLDFFYIAELLPGASAKLKAEQKNWIISLYHPECLELLVGRLFFQQEQYNVNVMRLSHILRFSANERDIRHGKAIRQRMKNSYLSFIPDPTLKTELSYLVHFWTFYRDREFLTRWNPQLLGEEIHLFGGIGSYLEVGQTLVFAGIDDPTRSLSRQTLSKAPPYRNFQDFRIFLEERLTKASGT